MTIRPPRAKDVLKDYLRTHRDAYDVSDHVVPYLYDFVYWLEGQDLLEEDSDKWVECRYHVVPAADSTCPFDFREADQLDRPTEVINQ